MKSLLNRKNGAEEIRQENIFLHNKIGAEGEGMSLSKIVMLIIIVIVIIVVIVFIYNPDLLNALRNTPGYGTPDDKDIQVLPDQQVPPPECPVRVGKIMDEGGHGMFFFRCPLIEKVLSGKPVCNDADLKKVNLKVTNDDVYGGDIRLDVPYDKYSGLIAMLGDKGVSAIAYGVGSEEYRLDAKVGAMSNKAISFYPTFVAGIMQTSILTSHQIMNVIDSSDPEVRNFLRNADGGKLVSSQMSGNWICRNEVVPREEPSSNDYPTTHIAVYNEDDAIKYGVPEKTIAEWKAQGLIGARYGFFIDSAGGDAGKQIVAKYLAANGFAGSYLYNTWDVIEGKGVGNVYLRYLDDSGKMQVAASYVDKDGKFHRENEASGKKYFFDEKYLYSRFYDNPDAHWDPKYYNDHADERVKALNDGGILETKWVDMKSSEIIHNYNGVLGFRTTCFASPINDEDLVMVGWKRIPYTLSYEDGTKAEGSKVYVEFKTAGDYSYATSPWIMQDYLNYYGKQSFIEACKNPIDVSRLIFNLGSDRDVNQFCKG